MYYHNIDYNYCISFFFLFLIHLNLNIGTVTCIRPNGQLHVLLTQSGEIVFVPLETVRAGERSCFEMRLLPPTKDLLSVLILLLVNATAEMERIKDFEEDYLRQQHVKLMHLRAARAVLAHRDFLRRILTSPVASEAIPQNSIPINIDLQTPDAALVSLCSLFIHTVFNISLFFSILYVYFVFENSIFSS